MIDRHQMLCAKPASPERLSGEQLRLATLRYIDCAVRALERERQDPDAWEGPHLARAIGYACVELFLMSIGQVELAIAEPEARGRLSWRGDRITREVLREALDDLLRSGAEDARLPVATEA